MCYEHPNILYGENRELDISLNQQIGSFSFDFDATEALLFFIFLNFLPDDLNWFCSLEGVIC